MLQRGIEGKLGPLDSWHFQPLYLSHRSLQKDAGGQTAPLRPSLGRAGGGRSVLCTLPPMQPRVPTSEERCAMPGVTGGVHGGGCAVGRAAFWGDVGEVTLRSGSEGGWQHLGPIGGQPWPPSPARCRGQSAAHSALQRSPPKGSSSIRSSADSDGAAAVPLRPVPVPTPGVTAPLLP